MVESFYRLELSSPSRAYCQSRIANKLTKVALNKAATEVAL
jgi:hypothetical protein